MAKLGLTKELYFTTSTVIDWMDVFTRPAYKQIIVESLKYCQQLKGLEVYAWVLMTNHLHMIVGMANSPSTILIGDVLRDFKKYTSKAIKSHTRKRDRKPQRVVIGPMLVSWSQRCENKKLQVLARRKLYRNHSFLRIL